MVSFNAVNYLTGTIVSKLYDSETTATFLALATRGQRQRRKKYSNPIIRFVNQNYLLLLRHKWMLHVIRNTSFVFNLNYGVKKYLDYI